MERQCADPWVAVPRWARAEASRYEDRWVVVLRSARAEVPQSAGQRAAASLQARRVMLPCGAPRVTSQLVRADRTRTSIVVRTFMVGPTRIMAGALLRQVSRQGPLLVPRQPPHTTTRITRNLLSISLRATLLAALPRGLSESLLGPQLCAKRDRL